MAKKTRAAKTVIQDAPKDREVTVQWANVWTSKGKLLKGATVVLPATEIKELGEAVK